MKSKIIPSAFALATMLLAACVPENPAPAPNDTATPSSNFILVASTIDGLIKKIDTDTNTVVETLNTGCAQINSLHIMADNKTAYGACSNLGLMYIDLDSFTLITNVVAPNNPIAVAMLSDASKAYVSQNSGGNISVIDVAAETITDTISGAMSYGGGFGAVLPDDSKAYLSTSDGSNLVVLDTSNDAVMSPVATGSVTGMAMASDGSILYAAQFGSNDIAVIDTSTDSITSTLATGVNGPRGLGLSPDESTAAVATTGGNSVSIIDIATNTLALIDIGAWSYCATFSKDGGTVYICDYANDQIIPIDVATKVPGTPIAVGDQPLIAVTYN